MNKIHIIGTNQDGLQKIEAEFEVIGLIEVNGKKIYPTLNKKVTKEIKMEIKDTKNYFIDQEYVGYVIFKDRTNGSRWEVPRRLLNELHTPIKKSTEGSK